MARGTSVRASGHTAVMAGRREPPDSLDFFPTPPWATRALIEHVLCLAPSDAHAASGAGAERAPEAPRRCWEPAAGEGHMAGVLAELFDEVYRTDVHDYGGLHAVGSFTGEGPDVVACPQPRPDWIVTNPPFNLAVAFAERALGEAAEGVALLLRTSWLEGAERWERLFRDRAPSIVAPFVERVPMVKGRWDPDASTATAYAWFVWVRGAPWPDTRLVWIPPGCRKRLERADDRERFATDGRSVPSEVTP